MEKRAGRDESSMDDEDNVDAIKAAKTWSLGKSIGLWAEDDAEVTKAQIKLKKKK